MSIKPTKRTTRKAKRDAPKAPVKKGRRLSPVAAPKTTKSAAKKSSASKKEAITQVPESPIVVGIGASAGGVEALRELFNHLPADSGLAFVVIQHLDPNHKSLMVNILGDCTKMPVTQIKRRTALKANHVYITPPNKSINIIKGNVSLTRPLEKRGAQMPINFFFHALAKDKHEAAIGIVLSGTGADGSSGLRSIKENGGLCIAQDPKTAAFDPMPVNAINTGMIDFILPISKIPDVLLRYTRSPYVAGNAGDATDPLPSPDQLTRILALLKTRLRRDFHYYKKSTLIRRVKRRMGIAHVNDMKEYLTFLRKKPTELDNLFKDILIGVTQFFRDPDTFDALAKKAIPKIIKDAPPGKPIRVWVPGCSTGEEAYTIAMLLIEALTTRKLDVNIQIFATDIDAISLDKARMGIYPCSIEADVSASRLRRFFIKEGDQYRVVKQLRECVAFAEQNLISDPPFSKLDLISCRNLLIYVEQELQRKIISLFQYALNDQGYLLLGTSETIGRLNHLFNLVDKKSRIYRSLNQVKQPPVEFPIVSSDESRPRRPETQKQTLSKRIVFSDLTHRLLSETYAPASVLINRNSEPLHFFGPVDRYLKLPSGDYHQDIVSMARDGLMTKLRSLIRQVIRSGESLTMDGVSVHSTSGVIKVSIYASAVLEPKAAEGLFLVAFSEDKAERADIVTRRPRKTVKIDAVSETHELERELQATREDLQSTIEEMETSNEELKASNEEAMSMNEELQSSNEELETSKEEMQSLNEELNTVNAELQDKVEELEKNRNDIANLLSSTDIGTLFLDSHFRIKRFTPAVAKLINIQMSDAGRKLSDFTKLFKDNKLLPDCKSVFERLVPIEREIQADDGRWYVRRTLPYRTEENKIEGVVITFTDVTTIKEAQIAALRMAAIIRDSNDAITLQGLNGQILAWNAGAVKMYGYSEAEALKMNIRQLVPPKDRTAALDLIYQAIEKGQTDLITVRRITKDKRALDVELTLTLLKDTNGEYYAVSSTERDITKRLRLEKELRDAGKFLEQRIEERTLELSRSQQLLDATGETAKLGGWEFDVPTQSMSWTKEVYAVHELPHGNQPITIDEVLSFYPKNDREIVASALERATETGEPFDLETEFITSKGNRLWVRLICKPEIGNGKALKLLGTFQDVTEKKRNELEILEAKQSAETLLSEKEVLIQEIHHRVKNNLQIISSLLHLQQSAASNKEVREAIWEAQRRVAAMAQLHVKIYQADSIDQISMLDYLNTVIDDITFGYHSSAPDIKVHFSSDDLTLPVKIAMPVAQILSELVSNCFKHAFPQKKGSIDINISERDGDNVELIVKDNGPALPENIDARNSKTLGLQLVAALSRQINGVDTFANNDGCEAKFTFRRLNDA